MAEPMFQKAPDGNYVYFEAIATKNEQASEKEGRPIFDKTIMVHVTSPGLTKSMPAFWVKRTSYDGKDVINAEYMTRYRAQFDAFEKFEAGEKIAGTPLEELPFLDVHTRAMLKGQNVHTAEALADLSDAGISSVGMGAREWAVKTKAYLEAAGGGAPLVRLASENEKLKAELERQAKTIAELAARIDEPRRGPGRPSKADAA